MSSKRKISHVHSVYKKKATRKKCPGCEQMFSSQYYKSHVAKYFLHNQWTCSMNNSPVLGNRNRSEHLQNDLYNAQTDVSSSEDNEELLKHNLKSLLKNKLRANVHSSDLLSDMSESDDEIWNDVSELDIESDIVKDKSLQGKSSQNSKVTSLVFWLCLFLCTWQALNLVTDTALNSILSFLSAFFNVLRTESGLIAGVAATFPSSVYILWRTLGLQKDNFQRFVVCKKCYALYKFEECIKVIEGEQISALCSKVNFPNHPQHVRRRACREPLLKTVILSSGKKKLYPFKTYCYKPIQETLYRLVHQKHFEDDCEKWRQRKQQPGFLTDVYDGKVWKEFQSDSKNKFLCTKRNYGLMLNLDWFQPFDHVRYSVGVLYAVVMNLPRKERFKLKNVILISIIPDLNGEPSMNSFLEPLVNEMKIAWDNGFWMTSFNSKKKANIFKFAFLCVGCDIPATRKLCGFLGHNAKFGCSKCFKEFTGGVGHTDYSGFDVENWPRRSLEHHRRVIEQLGTARTQTQLQELESEFGIRKSKICELIYFDPIRMSVVDPMHNLFQGTAKKMIKIWMDLNVLKVDHLKDIQAKVDAVDVACNVGAIPRKIASSFGGFTAEQWMNWTNVFSIYALKGILPSKHLEIWRHFVLASRAITSKYITEVDIKEFELHIFKFCKEFEAEYGKQYVTPNMHMHMHLASCVRDYGPVYSFWLFSFERYNGHLGSLPNNNRSIEIQLMRRFNRDSFVSSMSFPDLYQDEFSSVLEKATCTQEKDIFTDFDILKIVYMSGKCAPVVNQEWNFTKPYTFSKQSNKCLNKDDYTILKAMYTTIYPDLLDSINNMPMSYRKCSTISLGKEVFGSWKSRHRRSSVVMAYWHIPCEGTIATEECYGQLVPGVIQEFIFHNLLVGGESKLHIFAKIYWLQKLPDLYRYHCGKPVEVWSKDLYDVWGSSAFLPVQRIFCKCVRAEGKLLQKEVHFIFPLSCKLGI